MQNKQLVNKFKTGSLNYIRRNGGILIGLLVMCVVISIVSPIFLTERNIMNVLRQISSNFFLATSMTLVMISGGIDLSVGSIIAVIGVVGGNLAQSPIPIVFVILLTLMFGIGFGAVNGFIISRTTLSPFIVTLAMMSILRGIAYIITKGTTVRIDNGSYIYLGTGYVFGIPLPVLYMIVIFIAAYILLNRTSLGRHIFAVGGNARAAIYSGIKTRRVQMFVYIMSGLMSAMAGMVLSARSYSGNPIAGNGAEMDAIAACALGGVSLAGGIGSIGGMFLGTLIIGILNNGLNLMGVDSFWQTTLKGFIILAAVYIDYLKGLKKISK
ncbi:MAG: ABC transporter permease [Treponema sp.]|jgi:ribose transport system permease protein|nr:ABC transporter permease [Treponema sp.]